MIGIDYAAFAETFPVEVAIALIAMLPIAELRGAIPVGIGLGVPWWQVMIYATIGNLIPVVFILWFIEPVSRFLRAHSRLFERFFTWLFERTRKKFYDNHAKWGDVGLVVFVAIPLPVTGAWTGSLAAWLFGIPFRKALPLIAAGVIIAAVIVTLLSIGVFQLF